MRYDKRRQKHTHQGDARPIRNDVGQEHPGEERKQRRAPTVGVSHRIVVLSPEFWQSGDRLGPPFSGRLSTNSLRRE